MVVQQQQEQQGVVMMKKMVGKRMMMAPSIGGGGCSVGGGDMTTAFVTNSKASILRHRRSTASTSTNTAALFSSSASSLADDFYYRGGDQSPTLPSQSQQQLPLPPRVIRPDEPNLYNLPTNLHPTYQPMPLLLQITIIISAALLVGRRALAELFPGSSFFTQLLSRMTRIPRLIALSRRLFSLRLIRRVLLFELRLVVVSTMIRCAVQELFYMPSRVTTGYLAERGELPSRLSEYRVVMPLAVSTPTIVMTESSGGGVDDGGMGVLSTNSWNEEDGDATTKTSSIGVHSIRYTQQTTTTTTIINNNPSKSKSNKYDGIYLHHGFGASSLSWLPVLPSLVDKIGSGKGSAIGVAHDAPGFGFTDRPNGDEDGGLEQYGSENNAGIGLALLLDGLFNMDAEEAIMPIESCTDIDGGGDAIGDDDDGTTDNDAKSIAIFGHSMGSKAALIMALHCASHPKLQLKPNLVVLVAPALEGGTLPSRKKKKKKGDAVGSSSKSSSSLQQHGKRQQQSTSRIRKIWITCRKLFLDYPFQYGLRRLVSAPKDFWRKGLSLAWGNASRLTDSDVLRFQWPSIGKGWEEGLINFTRAKLLSLSTSPSHHCAILDDGQLLKEVANLKETTVVIMYGSKDGVVRIEGPVAEKLKKDYPNVKLVRMEGLGHDPFEEDVDGFLAELEKVLE